jgi:hypothetical protein
MSISTKCGDFSSETATGSSVVCRGNLLTSDSAIAWYGPNSATCALTAGTPYFLNIINADVSNVAPNGGGSATSSKTSKCTDKCSDVIYNGIGRWTYH